MKTTKMTAESDRQKADARARLIREARVLLAGLAQGLDDRGSKCPTCGLSKKLNWNEAQAREALEGIVERLERLEGRLGE